MTLTVDTIGVGNAYDGHRTNASLLIKKDDYQLLIDCGPSVPAAIFRRNMSVEEIDAIYITHTHPDHCAGLSTLLNWFDSYQRQSPLILYVQQQQQAIIEPLIQHAHWPKPVLGYSINMISSDALDLIGPWQVQTVKTVHSVSNLGLYIKDNTGAQLLYSGDGILSSEGEKLASICDWVWVECDDLIPKSGHGAWCSIEKLKKKSGSEWRLYHANPLRRAELEAIVAEHKGVQLASENERVQFCPALDGLGFTTKTKAAL
ncbi:MULTISPECIES: MBL fold metallo-hydrolase [unclassified Vibrio]|uniref:MBL fold metallo-hydrolase n=1 Tax=Vibrio sp. HB236076 TaxID=3232307 RepID=A0AB39HDV5_9VIBR|nr:MBL fold metallo-hydrolase [Vibrio sp. HB161653]MDP5254994.1 MBL fold metallo-hydrolase [Vibrio sp. HB161653]